MRLIPVYSLIGFLKDSEGNIFRMHRGHLYKVPTRVVGGEEVIDYNGKELRVKTLLNLGRNSR